MMEWNVILFVALLAISIVVIWVFTIKDIVKRICYFKSQKKTDGAYNDNCDNNPEPYNMSNVKTLDSTVGCDSKPYKERATNNGNNKPPFRFHLRRHCK